MGGGSAVAALRAQETARAQMNGIGSGVTTRAQLGVTFAQVLTQVANASNAFNLGAISAQQLAMEQRLKDGHARVMEHRAADLERHADDLRERVHGAMAEADPEPVAARRRPALPPPFEPLALLPASFP